MSRMLWLVLLLVLSCADGLLNAPHARRVVLTRTTSVAPLTAIPGRGTVALRGTQAAADSRNHRFREPSKGALFSELPLVDPSPLLYSLVVANVSLWLLMWLQKISFSRFSQGQCVIFVLTAVVNFLLKRSTPLRNLKADLEPLSSHSPPPSVYGSRELVEAVATHLQ